ncbi:MAG: hypothetical protein K8W52_31000 [Deltaproteobacteria bacterium]|nr:hypothetical protein [Deltaproteobacteria bacterium]
MSARGSSSPRSVQIAVSFGCPGCAHPIVLEAITAEARCRACLRTVALDHAAWASFAAKAVARLLAGDKVGRSTNFDRYTVVTRVALAAPTCACGAAIAIDDLDALERCACGAAIAIRRGEDAWLPAAIHDDIVAVIGERAPAAIAPVSPVAFRCACGAGLTTDGTTRAVRCATCGEVDVPLGLWDALHPTLPAPAMYALIGGVA